MFSTNYMLWYSLEAHRRGTSNANHNIFFVAKSENYYANVYAVFKSANIYLLYLHIM